ncbi:MAG: hypothetical protein ACF8PN_08400 [Phycisphaerales bacterium]
MTMMTMMMMYRTRANARRLRPPGAAFMVLLLLLSNAMAGVATAQQPEPPDTPTPTPPVEVEVEEAQPESNDPAGDEQPADLDRLIEELEEIEGADATPEAPPAGVGLSAADPFAARPARGRLLAEGTRLVDRLGWLGRASDGKAWVVWFEDKDEWGRPIPAMALMPSRRLETVSGLVGAGETEPVAVRVSGVVYVYDQRNYLLPTRVRRVGQTAGAAPERREEVNTPRTLDAMIADLESGGGGGAGARGDEPAGGERRIQRETLVAEGTMMVSRLGRMTRSGSTGAWMFVFESDDGSTGDDAPMPILPCRLLERMRAIAEREGDGAVLQISGVIYTYRDRNWLLPTMLVVPYERENLAPAS